MNDENQGEKVLKNYYIPTAEFYSQIIDSLQDYSIFTLDNDLMINSWSSGSQKIFGYDPEEIIGKHFENIFTAEDKISEIPKKETNTAIKEGRATDNRWHICKDNSLFYAHGLVFPLTGIDGEMLGFVKILRDITERKKSEDAISKYVAELEELNKHKETVLALLSHDLRSPLSVIIGTAGYLKSNFEQMEETLVKQMLDLLHKSSRDQLNMLDYLVEWARIKYAAEVFSPAKIELAGYVQQVFKMLGETAVLNTINLLSEVEENVVVFADSKMVISILQNIISNAIKNTKPGGQITVMANSNEDKVIVHIKDTGTGMSKETVESLFIPQVKTLLKPREGNKGAGIGLLLVKSFLEKNSGEIWVESEEGKGSSFYFSLPINKPPDPEDLSAQIEAEGPI
ncbi:MAG TPA: PAS domain-containing sensor histidine kinase [Ferruginibacter sp.]|nr:PAS domain-containing sensor histidine kinase [Ferruginibacter sp.]